MKWHKGPPPSIGWWPASVQREKNAIRWWNGIYWSYNAHPLDTAKDAAKYAGMPSGTVSKFIEWADRWWEIEK